MKYWNTFWDNPVALRRAHGWLTVGWATQVFLVAFSETVQNSVRYLVIISVVTAFLSQLANWQAARVEVRQAETDRRIEALLASLSAASELDEVDVPPSTEGAQNGS